MMACREKPKMCTSSDVLARPTLVLNRSWQPMHVTTVVRSLVMLWNESARAIDPADFRPYSWEQWMALPVGTGDPCIRTSRAPLRVPEVVGAPAVRPAAARRRILQPAERGEARPFHLPVLRYAAGRGRGDDRPCPAPGTGRFVELDELRGGLRGVQRPQGGPNPGAGRHEAPEDSVASRLEAAVRPARRSRPRTTWRAGVPSSAKITGRSGPDSDPEPRLTGAAPGCRSTLAGRATRARRRRRPGR